MNNYQGQITTFGTFSYDFSSNPIQRMAIYAPPISDGTSFYNAVINFTTKGGDNVTVQIASPTYIYEIANVNIISLNSFQNFSESATLDYVLKSPES